MLPSFRARLLSFFAYASLLCILPASYTVAASQDASLSQLPRIVQRDGRFALLVDGAPYLMLGAQVNNSSAWPETLSSVWPAIDYLHANTVEVPIYWEQFETAPGQYDDSVLKTLLGQAREHNVHLVLLWFGTWKNGSGHYTPAWIKLDNAKYPHVVNAKGQSVDSLSPHSQATLDADRTTFSVLMRHLKTLDAQHTVLMVQVENEAGTYGSVRDYSPAAQKLFAAPVPEKLLKALHKPEGNWQQVFGANADELFHAWSIAHYIDQVAAAGKAEYPLPFIVNVALRDPFHPGAPGGYASGGPTDNVLAIWKAAAPSIDVIGPDIYMSEYAKYVKVLDLYARADNAMFVPETGNSVDYARFFFAALGHGAIGFSPFGMDYSGYVNYPLGAPKIEESQLEPFAMNYRLIGPMVREIAKLNFDGKLQAVSEDPAVHTQVLDFGEWKARVSYGLPQFGSGKEAPGNANFDGSALVAKLGENEFLVTGFHSRVDFEIADSSKGKQRQFLRVEEGFYQDGVWHFRRIWNGDQTDYGLNFTSVPQVLRVTLATY